MSNCPLLTAHELGVIAIIALRGAPSDSSGITSSESSLYPSLVDSGYILLNNVSFRLTYPTNYSNDNDNYDTSGKCMEPWHHSPSNTPFNMTVMTLVTCWTTADLTIHYHTLPYTWLLALHVCVSTGAMLRLPGCKGPLHEHMQIFYREYGY